MKVRPQYTLTARSGRDSTIDYVSHLVCNRVPKDFAIASSEYGHSSVITTAFNAQNILYIGRGVTP